LGMEQVLTLLGPAGYDADLFLDAGQGLIRVPGINCRVPAHASFPLNSDRSSGAADYSWDRIILQIAEDDDGTIGVRQAAQLLVEQRSQIVPEVWFKCGWFRYSRHQPFPNLSLGDRCPGVHRRLVCHPVEPVGEQ